MCPVEHMCSEDGSYSPNNCNLIQDWLISSIESLSQLQYHTDLQRDKQHPELSAKQAKLSAKRNPRRPIKNNKK
jgi:hypothetical protein